MPPTMGHDVQVTTSGRVGRRRRQAHDAYDHENILTMYGYGYAAAGDAPHAMVCSHESFLI